MFGNFDLVQILSAAIALLLGLTFHEFAHAWVANLLGDPTPRMHGRVTLNPLAHLDPLGTIMLLLMMLGFSPIAWGKPVPINPYYMRGGRRGAALATAAGPLSNLVLALVIALIVRLSLTLAPQATTNALARSEGLYALVFNLLLFNVVLMVFNLIPLPPLDGFGILEGLAPPAWDRVLATLRQYGMWILLLVVFLGGRLGNFNLFGTLYAPLGEAILRLAGLW